MDLTKIDILLTMIVLKNSPRYFLIFLQLASRAYFSIKNNRAISKAPIALQNAAPLELQSPLVTFVFFSRYQLPMSNKFTTFVPEIK